MDTIAEYNEVHSQSHAICKLLLYLQPRIISTDWIQSEPEQLTLDTKFWN